MTVRPPLASRLIYGAGGSATGVIFLCLGVYAFVSPGSSIVRGFDLVGAVAFSGILAVLAYWGGLGTELRADATTVGLYPSIGAVKVAPRQQLGSITRVLGVRGTVTYRLVSLDGTQLMETGASYRRSDLEQFAQFVGVPLRWDADK